MIQTQGNACATSVLAPTIAAGTVQSNIYLFHTLMLTINLDVTQLQLNQIVQGSSSGTSYAYYYFNAPASLSMFV